MFQTIRSKHAGGAVVWLLVLLSLGAGAFLILKRQPAPSAEVAESKSPAETVAPEENGEPTPEETPVPVEEEAIAEVVAEEPVATPAPTPVALPPLTLVAVAQDRSLWPKEVALTRPTELPAIMNGAVVGSVKKPVGSIFQVTKITGAGIEVVFNKAPATIPASSTDLLARATQLRPDAPAPAADAFVPTGSTTTTSVVSTDTTSAATSAAPPKLDAGFLPASKLIVEPVRVKRSRIEGGDWDDKMDHVRLRVKVRNPDARLPSEKLSATIYLFAESILQRDNRMLLGRGSFDSTVAARQEKSFTTDDFSCAYDTTGARFGYKFCGWIVDFKNEKGERVFTKASAPSLEKAIPKLANLADKAAYDGAFSPTGLVAPH